MNDKTDTIFCEVFDGIFSESDWDNWVEGKINLFDVYMEKTGASKEEVQRIQEKYKSTKKDAYQDFIDNPVVISKTQKNK